MTKYLIWLGIMIHLLGIVTPSEGMILCLKKDGRAGLELSLNGNQCEPCFPPLGDKDCADFCIDIPISLPAANQHSMFQQDTTGTGVILSRNQQSGVLQAKGTSNDSVPQDTCLPPPLALLRSTILLI